MDYFIGFLRPKLFEGHNATKTLKRKKNAGIPAV